MLSPVQYTCSIIFLLNFSMKNQHEKIEIICERTYTKNNFPLSWINEISILLKKKSKSMINFSYLFQPIKHIYIPHSIFIVISTPRDRIIYIVVFFTCVRFLMRIFSWWWFQFFLFGVGRNTF